MSRYIDESIKSFIYDLETEAKSAHDDDPDNEYLEGYFDALHHAAKELSTAPTVDAVPVCRCAQCKWCEYPVHNSTKYGCRLFDRCVKPDWFCADGERWDDDV